MRLVKRIRRQNFPEAYADIIRSFTVHPHLVLCRSLARSSSSTKVGGRQSRELTPDQPKAACFAFGDSGVFRIEGPAFATTSSTLSLCFQKLDPSAGTEGSNPVASSGESIQTRLSAEDTQYPFVAADSIQAAALPCWLILWSSARPLVNAAGPGCKISTDLISYTSWCCVAGFRLKPGRAALVQAGISCRTRPNDQIRCLFDHLLRCDNRVLGCLLIATIGEDVDAAGDLGKLRDLTQPIPEIKRIGPLLEEYPWPLG